MDPNACLARIRALLPLMYGDGFCAADEDNVLELAQHVESLDGWLTRGGFLPAVWDCRHDETVGPGSTPETVVCSRCQREFPL